MSVGEEWKLTGALASEAPDYSMTSCSLGWESVAAL